MKRPIVQCFIVLEGAKCHNLPFTLEAMAWHAPDYWTPEKLTYAAAHIFVEHQCLTMGISQGSPE